MQHCAASGAVLQGALILVVALSLLDVSWTPAVCLIVFGVGVWMWLLGARHYQSRGS